MRVSAARSVTASAPGRVNLIGEHTDYNGGFVLPFALPQRTTVTLTPADRWSVTSHETVTAGALEPTGTWADYVLGVAWALNEAGHEIGPFAAEVSSDVPLGSGLSSSAALECATLTAAIELAGLGIPLGARPALAQRAENAFVGVPCGIMDQSASILAQPGHALLLDCASLETEHIPFGGTVLVIDTKAPHRLVDGEYAARRSACEAAASALGVPSLRQAAGLSELDGVLLRRARHVTTENDRVLAVAELLRAGQVREIGPLMTDSHMSLRYDFEVTVPELDIAVTAALEGGAYGARMTGGGFGGCVIALVEPRDVANVAESVENAFARAGFTAPVSFVATPSGGAALV
ncbi:galactokinase [Longispora albida]|uniref:galactokinase n=1 Tax=Longispora albida TaxID=203523 RepID=UPI000370D4C2|nr:galactokinase [Longispora albida]